jgi:predicted ribonuclease YlaK
VPSDTRPVPLIDGEMRYQKNALNRLQIDLETRLGRARGDALIAVLDTHTLLHHEPSESIPWSDIVGHSPVRLVIPLRVIEEIDAKKYSRPQWLRDRARAVLPHISDRVGLWGDPVAEIRDGVTLEVLVETGPRERPGDGDEEILDTCRELWEFSGRPEGVTLITNDLGMRLRANAIGGIRPVSLADEYRRDKEEPASGEGQG